MPIKTLQICTTFLFTTFTYLFMINLCIGVTGRLGPYLSGRLLADPRNIIDTGLVRYAGFAFNLTRKVGCDAR